MKKIFSLLTAILFVGTLWATNYISYNGTMQDASTTISSSNVSTGSAGKISWTGTSCTYSSSRVNIAANGTITFTASEGFVITKIIITSGSSNSYYGTWTSTPAGGTPSSANEVTLQGFSSQTVTITTSTAFRCTSASSIKIYYTAAAVSSDPEITADVESVDFGTKNIYNNDAAKIGNSTIKVTGANLTAAISADLSGTNANKFSLSAHSLDKDADDTELIVSYNITETGTYSASLTLSSPGATDVVIPITLKVINVNLVTDVLTATLINQASYGNWSGKTASSDAVYAGNSTTSSAGAIQLRDNTNSGIVTTTSGGIVSKVAVNWNTNTASGRTLNVYGKNTAYSSSEDLYATATQGTKLGTIVYGTSTELNIDGSYTFIGLVSNSGAMYFDDIIISWIPATYTITFDANGGTGSMAAIENIAKNASQTLPANTFERTGYTFKGWATTEDGTKAYDDKATISSITEDIELYAVWEANTTLVTLRGNGIGSTDGAATIDYDSSDFEEITHASWAAHDLQGYFTATSEGTKIINADGTLVSGVENYTSNDGKWIYTADDELELYAQWVEITKYSIVTTLTGCTADEKNVDEFDASETSVTLNFALTDAERTWTGVSVAITMGGNTMDDFLFNNGELLIEPKGGFTGNLAITVSAPEKTYTVTIGANDDNYGSAVFVVGEEELDEVTVAKSATTEIKAIAKMGYRFVNWACDENVTFTNENTAETTVTAVSEDAIIIANFEEIPAATLTLSENGKERAFAGSYKQGDIVTLPTEVVTGVKNKVLVGWDADEFCIKAPTYAKGASYTLSETSQTLYAVYATEETPETSGWASVSLNSLTSTDVFVLGSNEYALPNNAGDAASPLVESITVDGDEITSEVGDNLKWNVSGNSTDGYTFYPNGTTTTWLYCNTTAKTKSNDNIRIGTGDRKVWILDNNGYLVTNDAYTDRYLSIYSDQDFRGYVNTTNGAFEAKFYKYSKTDPIYSEYATRGDVPTALDNTEAGVKAVKVLRNGQLFIEKNGKTFTAQGQLVK